jgi:hypothetical protein
MAAESKKKLFEKMTDPKQCFSLEVVNYFLHKISVRKTHFGEKKKFSKKFKMAAENEKTFGAPSRFFF